ncbi:hypothetical protein FOCC_FOCC004777, partial [Frankliniella occidentalis]
MKVPWVHRSGVLWFLWVLWLAAAQDTPPPGAAPTPAASHLTTVTASSGSPGDSHSVEPAASPAPSQASRAGTPAAGSSPAAVDLSNTSASRAAASAASAAPAQVEPPLPDVTLTTAVPPRADGPVPLEVTALAGPPRPSKGLSYGTAGSLAEPSLTPTSFGGLFTTTTPASTSAINATAPSSPVTVSTSTVASPLTVTTRTNTSSSVVTSAAPVVAPLQTLTTMISTSSFSVTVPITLPMITTETPTATTSVTLSVTAPVISSPSTAAAAPVTAPTVVPAPAPAIPSRPKRLHLPSELTVEPELHRLLLSTLAPDGYSELSGHPAALRQHRLGGASAGTGWPVKLNAVVEGDLVLGGLMMVHEREDSVVCGPIMPQGGIQALEAMLYTLDVINDDKEFLPGVVLGAHILDDCDKDTYGLEMAVDFI